MLPNFKKWFSKKTTQRESKQLDLLHALYQYAAHVKLLRMAPREREKNDGPVRGTWGK